MDGHGARLRGPPGCVEIASGPLGEAKNLIAVGGLTTWWRIKTSAGISRRDSTHMVMIALRTRCGTAQAM